MNKDKIIEQNPHTSVALLHQQKMKIKTLCLQNNWKSFI